MSQSVITRSADIMGGAAVFAGTRVPVHPLLDYLKVGDSIDEFLKGFPMLTREHVVALLAHAEAPRA